jgi:ABC-type thiamin/hydroxymethylpyrimidine transport system permease subunit
LGRNLDNESKNKEGTLKLAFGGLIALILLGLYVYSVFVAIQIVNCVAAKGCTDHAVADFSQGLVQAITLIGGLVSALVIAELAITAPGQAPMARALDTKSSPRTQLTLQIVTGLYLFVWVCAGVAAYVYGQMLHPQVLQPLTDLGHSWLGLAVAAGYAYFAIRPNS